MKNTLARVTIVVVALLLVCVGCSSSAEAPHYDVSHLCPEGALHVHRIAPDLDQVLQQGIIKAVDEWASIIGSRHPQSIVITNEASEQNITCVTSWLYNDEHLDGAFAVTEAGKVHFTTKSLPDNIKLQLPLHEMGHVLGLGDAKVKDSVMWKFIGPGQPITCQDRKDVCALQTCDPKC